MIAAFMFITLIVLIGGLGICQLIAYALDNKG